MRLHVGMKGDEAVMYSTFGFSAEAKGVGIAGWRSGRFVIVALWGSCARFLRGPWMCGT